MRVFFDTNVILAAFLAEGACKVLFRHVTDGTITGVVSEQVLDEVARNLKKLVKITPERRSAVLETVRLSFEVVPTPATAPRLSRDEDDDTILAAARASSDLLVTGDKDLLRIARSRAKLEILQPADLLLRIAAAAG